MTQENKSLEVETMELIDRMAELPKFKNNPERLELLKATTKILMEKINLQE